MIISVYKCSLATIRWTIVQQEPHTSISNPHYNPENWYYLSILPTGKETDSDTNFPKIVLWRQNSSSNPGFIGSKDYVCNILLCWALLCPY